MLSKSDITRDKILKAAEDVFAEKGLFGARVDEIAEVAGVNKRMIYVHFENKENLYTQVIKRAYKSVASLEKEFELTLPPREAIRNIIKVYFGFHAENPKFVSLIMWENLNEAKYVEASGAAIIKDESVKAIGRIIKKGVEDGVFRGDVSENEIIFAMNMFCFSYFSNKYTMTKVLDIDLGDKSKMEERSDMVADMIIKYLSI